MRNARNSLSGYGLSLNHLFEELMNSIVAGAYQKSELIDRLTKKAEKNSYYSSGKVHILNVSGKLHAFIVERRIVAVDMPTQSFCSMTEREAKALLVSGLAEFFEKHLSKDKIQTSVMERASYQTFH